MGAIATFDPAAFVARYPELAGTPASVLTLYAGEATLYLANDGTGPVSDPGQQLALLNMLVAHLASLNATVPGPGGTAAPASPLVGRISSASEGGVSVSASMGAMPGSAEWFGQTKYGFAFYQATAVFRTMCFIPNPRCGRFGYGRLT